MTPEDERFLSFILKDPADDCVRAAWADHLMDRGVPFGEMIAAQLRDPSFQYDGATMLGYEFLEFLWCGQSPLSHLALWTTKWTEPIAPTYTSYAMFYFLRGLPAYVFCPLTWWHRWGAEAVMRFPLEKVLIADRKPYHDRHENKPWLPGTESWTWLDTQWNWNEMLSSNMFQDGSALPHELADAVCWITENREGQSGYRYQISNGRFRTEKLAIEGLSAGCLRWAKTQAKKKESDNARRDEGRDTEGVEASGEYVSGT